MDSGEIRGAVHASLASRVHSTPCIGPSSSSPTSGTAARCTRVPSHAVSTTSWMSCGHDFSSSPYSSIGKIYATIGKIYATLDLGCVISMLSVWARRTSSEQVVLQEEQGNDEDR